VIIAADRDAHVVLTGEAEVGKVFDFSGKIEFASFDKLYQRVAGEHLTIMYLLLRPRPATQGLDSQTTSPEIVRAAEVRMVEPLPGRVPYRGGIDIPGDGANSGYAGGNDVPNIVYDTETSTRRGET